MRVHVRARASVRVHVHAYVCLCVCMCVFARVFSRVFKALARASTIRVHGVAVQLAFTAAHRHCRQKTPQVLRVAVQLALCVEEVGADPDPDAPSPCLGVLARFLLVSEVV